MIKVLFCASEVAPFAKTGGLADVAGTLPLALGELGAQVEVLMPRYRGLPVKPKRIAPNVRVSFIENEAYFNRASFYGQDGGYPDNLKRFSFFSREVLAWARREDFKPHIVHAHDWQTALVPVYLKTRFSSDSFFEKTRTLLTIHNLAYQGHFPSREFRDLGLDASLFSIAGLEFYGKINLLKGGLLHADALSTVSPTYAKEIQTIEYGFGLEGVIRQRSDRLRGILNGIHTALWNPARDMKIKKRFSADAPVGKAVCKRDLQQHCGFAEDASAPVFGVVSRLAEQKGFELLSEISDRFFSRNVQFVLLGEGDAVYHTLFSNIAKRHPANVRVHLGFSATEAHRIYAGCDFFLMPSYFEPCGLGQMISLRYGTLPVVRHTGGLADSIVDADRDPRHGNGFVFHGRNPESFYTAIGRAIQAFQDNRRFQALRRHAMLCDFSWQKSAKAYLKFYREMLRAGS